MLTSTFYFLAFVTIFFAIMVVVSKNPVHSVLYLVLAFFGISANYIFMLDAPFVGIVNIIVYAGAIMVLFLFVIMLINLNTETERQQNIWMKFFGVISGGLLLWIFISASRSAYDVANKTAMLKEGDVGLIQNLGKVLFNEYALPFEISSILFLSAMVGAVVIGKKD